MKHCPYCGRPITGTTVCQECVPHNDDEYDREDDIDEDYYENEKEQEAEERADRAALCKCGAWVFNSKGQAVHVADCFCGAE